MHGHVIAISSRTGDLSAYRTAARRLRRGLVGWEEVFTAPGVTAWVRAEPPSKLGHRPLDRDGCLIGRDFHAAPGGTEVGWGAYLHVRVDRARGRTTVRRDPTGRIECWRLSLEGVDLLFSAYRDIFWMDPNPGGVHWDALAHHLNHDWLHGDATCLEGVTELLAGEEITYGWDGVRKLVWWRPDAIAAEPHACLAEAQTALREAAETTVQAWAPLYHGIVLDLSGGLDSAIVLGLLQGRGARSDITGLNKITPGVEGDESHYARLAAQRHGTRLLEREPRSDLSLEDGTAFSRRLMRPRNRLLPTGFDELGVAAARETGAEAYFSGIGGDHVFGSTIGPEAACDYLHHGGTAAGFLDTAVSLAQLSQDTVWSVFREVIDRTRKGRASAESIARVSNRFLSDRGREAVDFTRFGHPLALDGMGATPPAKFRQILYMLELQRHYRRYGRADASEEVHPLFSEPVFNAALRTPAHWFGVDGVQRGLARRAFADLLPEEIRLRRSKGGTTMYFLKFLGRRLTQIREMLLEGRLAQQGLLDRAAVEAELTPTALAAAREFGAVCLCLTAEMWVRQTEADRAAALAATRV